MRTDRPASCDRSPGTRLTGAAALCFHRVSHLPATRTAVRAHADRPSSTVVALVAGLVIAIDTAEKAFLVRPRGEALWLAPGLYVRVTSEPGAAVGLLSCGTATVAAAAAAVVIVSQLAVGRTQWRPAALGLVVGGLLSNVIDSLGDGRVTEFIQPPAWSAFNYGDVALTVGAVWLSCAALRCRRRRYQPTRR